MEQSLCYNWEAVMEHPMLFDTHSEVVDALLGFLDDSSLLPFDSLFQQDLDTLISSTPTNGGECGNPLLLPSPKRHRSCSNLYIHEQPPPLLEPSLFFYSIEDPTMVAVALAGCDGGSLSAQSVAAKERRKRISEKTQELVRLIPDRTKMNIAEILQAAFKYVKFLQAQLGILHLAGMEAMR